MKTLGRIKTKQIKRATIELMNRHGNVFKKDFAENCRIVSELADIRSKKLRNTIAGYITRLSKSQSD